jgi:hypothetical protein
MFESKFENVLNDVYVLSFIINTNSNSNKKNIFTTKIRINKKKKKIVQYLENNTKDW